MTKLIQFLDHSYDQATTTNARHIGPETDLRKEARRHNTNETFAKR